MKYVVASTAGMNSERKRPATNRLWELVAWLLRFNADRWRQRALFYGRHRDYFPRLSAGRFVERCREMEMTYRGLSEMMLGVAARDQWVPVRAIAAQRNHR